MPSRIPKDPPPHRRGEMRRDAFRAARPRRLNERPLRVGGNALPRAALVRRRRGPCSAAQAPGTPHRDRRAEIERVTAMRTAFHCRCEPSASPARPHRVRSPTGALSCCSDACARRLRRDRRQRTRPLARCCACRVSFAPSRADAIYCSSACRQWSYRRRLSPLARLGARATGRRRQRRISASSASSSRAKLPRRRLRQISARRRSGRSATSRRGR